MSKSDVAYLVFDCESVADGELIAKTRYPGFNRNPAEAIATFQDERSELTGSNFIPHTYQIPVAVVIAKVKKDGTLIDISSLDEPSHRPHIITENFWRGWEIYKHPTWVTFNGRSFDIPLMELAAFRYGISLQDWFGGSGYAAPRNRYNKSAHMDLQEVLTNYGSVRCHGGLNLMANLINRPGKMGMDGDGVQAAYDRGELQQISDYCRCDVLDTYFVFLRTQTMMGVWSIDHELKLIDKVEEFLRERSDEIQAYADYLEHWETWSSPWTKTHDDSSSSTDLESESKE